MVAQKTLNLFVLVRIQLPQPIKEGTMHIFFKWLILMYIMFLVYTRGYKAGFFKLHDWINEILEEKYEDNYEDF